MNGSVAENNINSPEIVIFDTKCPSICLLELTCPLDSPQHIQAARDKKQSKIEYLQLLAKFDHLKIRHYIMIQLKFQCQPPTVKNLLKLLAFAIPELSSVIKDWLDYAAAASNYLCLTKNFPGKEL